MSRLLTLVIPICLAVSACTSPPSDTSVALAAGFNLDALHVSLDRAAETGPDAGTTESFGRPARSAALAVQDGAFSAMSSRHVTILAGLREMYDDEWDPVEDQFAAGIEIDATDPLTGHGYEVGLTYSEEDDDAGSLDAEGNTFDVYGGYRHTFRPETPNLHPYVSAGLALIRAEVEVDGPGPNSSDADTSPAAYVRGGVGFDLQERTRLGIDYRHLFISDVDIGGVGDADFDQIMLTLSFAF